MDTAKLFRNGRSQAVRLPKEYRIEGSEVYITKIEDVIILIPKDSRRAVMEKSLECFTTDYMKDRNQPKIEDREDL